jgi:hypothetical protein
VTLGRTVVLAALAMACARSPGPEATPNSVSLPREAKVFDDAPGWRTPPAAYRAERNRCIDRELATRKLNAYGDPEGTSYPGGSPDLSVARGMDRYDYVLRHRRDIAVRCTRAPGEPEP